MKEEIMNTVKQSVEKSIEREERELRTLHLIQNELKIFQGKKVSKRIITHLNKVFHEYSFYLDSNSFITYLKFMKSGAKEWSSVTIGLEKSGNVYSNELFEAENGIRNRELRIETSKNLLVYRTELKNLVELFYKYKMVKAELKKIDTKDFPTFYQMKRDVGLGNDNFY